jgi:hypothetical protein
MRSSWSTPHGTRSHDAPRAGVGPLQGRGEGARGRAEEGYGYEGSPLRGVWGLGRVLRRRVEQRQGRKAAYRLMPTRRRVHGYPGRHRNSIGSVAYRNPMIFRSGFCRVTTGRQSIHELVESSGSELLFL